MTLYIGAENWPFPMPLVKKDGAWRFDSDAGTKEIMFRRIGENYACAIKTAAMTLEQLRPHVEFIAPPDIVSA